MTIHTTIRSWSAMLLGLTFAALTLRVILDDVAAGAPFTTAHMLSIGALAATVFAGHQFCPTLRAGRVVPALGLALVFLGGTAYCITASTMRAAETDQAKDARALKGNGDRARWDADDKAARVELARIGTVRTPQSVRAAMDAAPVSRAVFARTRECTEVTRADSFEACRPILDLRREMADAIRKTELEQKRDAAHAALDKLGPAVVVAGGYHHVAKVYVIAFGGDEAHIADALETTMPVIKALIAELATMVFLGLGLGHTARKARAGTDTAQTSFPKPTPPKGKGRRGATRRDPKVVAFVAAYRKRHGCDPSIPTMQAAFPSMASSTAQRYRHALGGNATPLAILRVAATR